MGNAASKTARRCLKPGRVTATEPINKNRPPDTHRNKGQNSTSYYRQISLAICVVEIEQDAGDPHFLANLSRLGVRVNHSMETALPVGYMFL